MKTHVLLENESFVKYQSIWLGEPGNIDVVIQGETLVDCPTLRS